MHYKNFKTAVYLPAWIIERLDSDKLASDYEFMERYIGVDKVYIEKVLPAKMVWNLETVRKFSFFREIRTMFRTVAAVLGKDYE